MKKHKAIRLVQRKNESFEEFQKRVNITKKRQGDNYLTMTQPAEEHIIKGVKNIYRTFVNIVLKEEI